MEIDKNVCPVVSVDGFIEKGKQFDMEIIVPEDDRNVIYGVLKNKHGEPIQDAVIKLIRGSKSDEEAKELLSLMGMPFKA